MWDCPFRPARSPAETSQVVKNPIKPPLIPRRRLSFGKDPNLPAQDPPGTCFCSQKLLKGDIIPVSEEKQVSSISSWNEHNHTLTTWESSELHVLHRQLLYASCLLSKSRIHNYHKESTTCAAKKNVEWDVLWTPTILNLLHHRRLFTLFLSQLTVPEWISNCNQGFWSSTLKICCFSHGRTNPKTSALQIFQQFIVSLFALFLNTGSSLLWNPPVFNADADYLLSDHKCFVNVDV